MFSWGWTGLFVGIGITALFIGWWQAIVAMLGHGVLFVLRAGPLINGLGHWAGAQNFRNTAYNSRVLAWLTGGESLHNNHHAFPRSPKFSLRCVRSWTPRGSPSGCWPPLRLVAIVGAPLSAAARER